MATISDAGFTKIKEWVRGNKAIYNEFRTWGITKTTLKSALQAVENYMISAFSTTPTTSVRSAIEAVTGATTPTRAQYVFVVWAQWKLYNYLGGL